MGRNIFVFALVVALVSLVSCSDEICSDSTSQPNVKVSSGLVSQSTAQVSTFEELLENCLNETKLIELTENIQISETVFISGEKRIFCSGDISVSRADGFSGDLFVIGSKENVLAGNTSELVFYTENDAKLVIDGNNIESSGSCFFICDSGRLELKENVTIKNFVKKGNERTLDNQFILSDANQIGGAAAIIVNGSLNLDGAIIQNCMVSTEDNSESYCGGAIYNYGELFISSGQITNCSAARGGAIYNYRVIHISGGELNYNESTSYGGVIYQANSQYCNLFLGNDDNSSDVLFSHNTSGKSGGVIFGKMKTSITVLGNVSFLNNNASGSGGVIYTSGSLIINKATFRENSSSSYGGAIYYLYDDAGLTPRECYIYDSNFDSNQSTTGAGAIMVNTSLGSDSNGNEIPVTRASKMYISNSRFSDNHSKNGGAIYGTKLSSVYMDNLSLQRNKASSNGGALYATGEAILTVSNSSLENNSATSNGGAVYATGASKIKIDNSSATSNSAKSGGFLYLTTTNTEVTILSGSATANNVSDNEKGSCIFSNTNKARLVLSSSQFEYSGTIKGNLNISYLD